MGVTNLLPLLAAFMQAIAPDTDLSSDPRIGMDASVMIHALLTRFMEAIIVDSDWTGFTNNCRFFLRSILAWNDCTAQLLLVFDGIRQHAKLANANRSASRQAAIDDVAKAIASGEEVDGKIMRRAIHAYAIKAMYRIQDLCDELQIPWMVAPAEAEGQLRMYQRRGVTEYLLVNDSDYVPLNSSNIIFADNTLWQQESRYFAGPDVLDTVHGKAALEQMKLTVGKKERDSPHSLLAKAIEVHGWEAVQTLCEFMKTDYSNIAQVKEGTVLPHLANLKRGVDGDHPLRVRVAQAIAQKEAQTAGNRRPRLGDGDRYRDILRQAETAAIMFRCPAVYDPLRGCVVHLNDPTTIGVTGAHAG
jgi:hypothetical protein